MDTLFIVRDSVITCASKAVNCNQHYEETITSNLVWPTVVAIGLFLAFVFALCWLYRPKENKKQKNNPNNQATNSKDKQLGELQDLLYKHLQTRVYLDKVDGGGKKYKEYNEANDKEYIQALKDAINELKAKVKNETKETQDNAS